MPYSPAMSSNSTDRDWERLGERDPYWAVLSDAPYHRENLSDAHLQAFLKSGDDHLEGIWRTCGDLFGASFAPRRALARRGSRPGHRKAESPRRSTPPAPAAGDGTGGPER